MREIEKAVHEALHEIQVLSGRKSCELGRNEKPISMLDGFDSLSALEATSAIEARLGRALPTDFCAFISKSGKRALTVGEACDALSAALGKPGGA